MIHLCLFSLAAGGKVVARNPSLQAPAAASSLADAPPRPLAPALSLQLQALAGQQAEVLVGVVQRMEKLEQDIKETGEEQRYYAAVC